MNSRNTLPKWFVFLALSLSLLACNFISQLAPSAGSPPQAAQPTSAGAGQPTSPPPPAGAGGQPVRQWAIEAVASSEYGPDSWAAKQATGAPNTPKCGDNHTAWASETGQGLDWINLYYQNPVYISEIRIYQTYLPDQVSQVELIDMQGNYISVFTQAPSDKGESACPYILTIPTNRSDVLAQGVRITVDQTKLQLGWNEIDAVEVIGVPGSGTPKRPIIPAP